MPKHKLNVVSISGVKDEEIELLEIAAHFYLKELAKIRKFGTIHGEITVVDKVQSDVSGEHLNGDMSEVKNYTLDNGDQVNYYVCRLADYANSAETMRTLAHELVHVWQTETGRLSVCEEKGWVWNGESFGFTPYADGDDLLPWEKEADTLDLQLTKKFYKQYFNIGKI